MALFLLAAAGTPALAQTVETLVSNTGKELGGTYSNIFAQAFTTGDNAEGYTLASVRIRMNRLNPIDTSSAGYRVRILSDWGGSPGSAIATLINPSSFTSNAVNTFTAPTGATLSANTTYWVEAASADGSRGLPVFTTTQATSEDGASGWSIANGRLWRNRATNDWSTSGESVMIEIRGSEISTPPPGVTIGGPIGGTDSSTSRPHSVGFIALGSCTGDLGPSHREVGTGKFTWASQDCHPVSCCGYKTLVGAQMRYAVHDRNGWPRAMLGFSTAARKLAPRDRFIGWTPQLREKNLPLVVDNPRFLILPWINIPNLGSHILAIVRRRLPEDWTERYNTTPVLIETFVETPRYTGAVYRASGWIHVGTTQGAGATTDKRDAPNRKRTSGFAPSEKIGNKPSTAKVRPPSRPGPSLTNFRGHVMPAY